MRFRLLPFIALLLALPSTALADDDVSFELAPARESQRSSAK